VNPRNLTECTESPDRSFIKMRFVAKHSMLQTFVDGSTKFRKILDAVSDPACGRESRKNNGSVDIRDSYTSGNLSGTTGSAASCEYSTISE